jgi:hypothetical protein
LTFQSVDGRIDGGQLALQSVAPEHQALVLALLMATAALGRTDPIGVTKEGRKHGKMAEVTAVLAISPLASRDRSARIPAR